MGNKEIQRLVDFYNKLAPSYESNALDRGVNETIKQEVAQIVSLHPSSIIEFGIGTGRFARAIVEELPANVRYVGVDISDEMLAYAKDLNSRVEIVKEDFETYLSNSQEHFDVCVAPYTVYCHVEYDNQVPLVKKIQEKSSHVFINVPTIGYEEKVWGKYNTVEFPVPQSDLSVTVFRIHPDLRKSAVKVIPLDGDREILYFGERA